MDEKDRLIQRLYQENARLKGRVIEACEKACFNCEEYVGRKEERCRKCPIHKYKEEAGK